MFTLRSVGFDVGSSTSSLVVSELVVGRPDDLASRRPEVIGRRLLHASPVVFTPFAGERSIHASALGQFFRRELRSVGLAPETIDTGALICTGEAARKENAAAVSMQLAAASGRFVCAAAGHHLEARLGAHGSGAVLRSRALPDAPIVLLDIGGGTTKRTVLRAGRVLSTAVLNVGARLVAWTDDGTVCRVEPAGAVLGSALGLDLRTGVDLPAARREDLAALATSLVLSFLRGEPPERLGRRLLLTPPPPPIAGDARLMISGGVAEYAYGRTEFEANDLGLGIGTRLRGALEGGAGGELLDCPVGIRSTVLGAGQFTVQVSGETVFHDGSLQLPLHGVPVRRVALDWGDVAPGSTAGAVERALGGAGPDGPVALAFGPSAVAGYRAARALGEQLGPCLAARGPGARHVLVFEDNVGRTVGEALADAEPGLAFMCVDELEAGDLDFLDVGPPNEHGVLPVVVKSLVFA